ncbi:MAG: sodium:calcium antiporter [Nitrospirae bacterium]|nr:sodium:calcium antiporter [Nitrospirota bacterium]
MLFLVLTFILCTAVIVVSATGLSRYADLLAEMTGIGKVWIGMTAVAVATSLPELSAGISAVAYAGSPNIALGDALGSCVFNLVIIALIDFMHKDGPLHVKLGPGNLLAACFGIVLIGVVSFGLVIQPLSRLSISHLGITTPLIIVVYVIASRMSFEFERRELAKYMKEEAGKVALAGMSVRKAAAMLLLCASGVAVSGTLLPKAGIELADAMGVGHGFFGSVFLAVSTSLPELVVAVSAVRMGSFDIAVGNVFGSNMFNCVVIAVDDIAYARGPILAEAASGQLITACIALVMTAVSLVGLLYKSKKKSPARVGWDSVVLIALYALNVVTSYKFSGGE